MNLALDKPAEQNDAGLNPGSLHTAEKAVNGNFSDYSMSTAARWKVDLESRYRIAKILVYIGGGK